MNCGSRHCESLQEANRCRQAGPGWRREAHALAQRMRALIRQLFLCDCVCLCQSQFVHLGRQQFQQHGLDWSYFLSGLFPPGVQSYVLLHGRVGGVQVHANAERNNLTPRYELLHTNSRNVCDVALKHTDSQHVFY